MKFYGVGTRFSGTEPFLEDCLKYGFWCMGDQDQRYIDLYKSIEVGDMLIAKKYYPEENVAVMDVEAVGIVRNLKMPDNVPARYKTSDKFGVAVVWIKVFPELLNYTSAKYKLGGTKPRTIFRLSYENDKEIIDKVFDNIKYK